MRRRWLMATMALLAVASLYVLDRASPTWASSQLETGRATVPTRTRTPTPGPSPTRTATPAYSPTPVPTVPPTGGLSPHREDLTDLLPDPSLHITGWAEDAEYVYLAGVVFRTAAYVVQIAKAPRSRVRTYALPHATAYTVHIGLKWGRIYAVTASDSQTEFWRVAPDAWIKLAPSRDCWGSRPHMLIETDEHLFSPDDCSPHGDWGMTLWRIDAAEAVMRWSSEAGSDYGGRHIAFSTGDRILLAHEPGLYGRIAFEDRPEWANDFFAYDTDTGYEGSWPSIWELAGRKFIYAGYSGYDGGNAHIRDYPLTLDRRAYDSSGYVAQVWASSDGYAYLLVKRDPYNQYLVMRVDGAMNIVRDTALYPLATEAGVKFQRAIEENPGFVWRASDGRQYLTSLRGVFGARVLWLPLVHSP